MEKWLNTVQTAAYLGISKTKLYELTQQNKLPVSKIGKKLMYSSTNLNDWMQSSIPIKSYFMKVNANITDNISLREPQREGYLSIYEHFKNSRNHTILQLPVGCGKTGLISILPFGLAKGRVLVIAPNLTIKQELYDNFDITNRQKCFWRKTNVLKEKDMLAGPYVCSLDFGNVSIAEKSHIIVTNIQQLATDASKWLELFTDDFFDLIINDEAHHTAAKSWQLVFSKFKNAKIINLTATPFRSDRKKIEGDLIYRYPFKSAALKGYIKRIKAGYLTPSELTFTDEKNEKKYTLKEILKMKEENWFSKGIALSHPCNVNIVDNSLEKLEKLRESGTKHQLIAVACSIRHAKQIRTLFSERGYNSEVIHSNMKKDEKETVIRDLKNGILDCIVQVQMLGEGFDHPKLSVASIFRPFRTLAPYIQFVGRILRVIVQSSPLHPDNTGYIVTHIGMNIDKLLEDFHDFENDDQKFWEKVTSREDESEVVPDSVLNGSERMTINDTRLVNGEIIESFIEEDFITPDDEDKIKELEKHLRDLGLNPELAKSIIEKDHIDDGKRVLKPAESFVVLPQRQWAELKKRLNEEIGRTAKLILNTCDLQIGSSEINRKYHIGTGQNNHTSLIIILNRKVNELISIKKDRKYWEINEFEQAINSLDKFKNELVRLIKGKQNEEKKR